MRGRFEAVRLLGKDGLSGPLIYDRGAKAHDPRLVRRDPDAWVGAMPAIRGGTGTTHSARPRWTLGELATSITQSTLALDSAYTFNSAGDAIAHRYASAVNKTLSSVYYYITARAGTTGTLSLSCRRNTTALSPVTGATQIGTTQTVTPSTTVSRWNQYSWSLADVGGHATDRYVWFCIGHPSGSAGNSWTILKHNTTGGNRMQYPDANSFSSTAGFASAITNDTAFSTLVLVFSDGSAVGSPWTTTTGTNANTVQQGLRIDGLTASLVIHGWRGTVQSGGPTAFYIWEGTGGPSAGTDLLSGVTVHTIAAASAPDYNFFASPVTLAAATQYRFTAEASSYGVLRFQLGTLASGSASDLMLAVQGGGNWYYTTESGGAWSDTTTEWPAMELIIEDQGAPGAGGGGGLRAAGRGGLAVGA